MLLSIHPPIGQNFKCYFRMHLFRLLNCYLTKIKRYKLSYMLYFKIKGIKDMSLNVFYTLWSLLNLCTVYEYLVHQKAAFLMDDSSITDG